MIDRQWQKMSQMEAALKKQAGDFRQLRQAYGKLAQGIASGTMVTNSGESAAPVSGVPAAFAPAKAVSELPDYAEGDWLV